MVVQAAAEVMAVLVVLVLKDKEIMAATVVHLAVAVVVALAVAEVQAHQTVAQAAAELPLTLPGQVQHPLV
jgi:hypothetical protein